MKYNAEDIWESFFSDPTLKRILEEAEFVDSDSDPELEGGDAMAAPEEAPSESPSGGGGGGGAEGMDIEQLSTDFQAGDISQEDLIKLYQSKKISKDEIQRIISDAEGGDEPETEEELLGQQIEQTNDMFVKFALYDKISDMTEKLAYFKENFDDIQSNIYDRVLQLNEFLNILSSLIFSIETAVSYQMYGSILLQLTELFDEYNNEQKLETAQEDAEDQQIENLDQQKIQLDQSLDLDPNHEDSGFDHSEQAKLKESELKVSSL